MRKPKKKLKKRIGNIGPIIFTHENGKFHPIKFPNDKEEIEKYIVPRLIQGLENSGENFYNLLDYPTQNPQDDFDFTLSTKSGIEYLELMETAILENVNGSYDAAPTSYNCGEMAKSVYEKK